MNYSLRCDALDEPMVPQHLNSMLRIVFVKMNDVEIAWVRSRRIGAIDNRPILYLEACNYVSVYMIDKSDGVNCITSV